MLKIRMVTNGWILEDHDDAEMTRYHVFEHAEEWRDGEKAEVEAFVRLLWTLNDLYGPTTSRYSKHRVSIRIVKGDKCDDYTEDEGIERPNTTSASCTDGE